ncbi:MAG: ATP-binding protein [Myxococcota bacterium]
MTGSLHPRGQNRNVNRVLIVEDNRDLAENLAEILTELDVQTRIAKDGAEALAAEPAQLALVDVRLPGDMSGLTLLRELRARSPDVAVVLMTGSADLASAIEAVQEGAFAYVLKPFDLGQLLGICERALAQTRLRLESAQLARALSESEALYRGVVDTVEALILGIDREQRIRFCNRFAQTLWGGEESAVDGRVFAEVCGAPDEAEEMSEDLSRALAGETLRDRQYTFVTAAGERRNVRWTFTGLDTDDGVAVTDETVLAVGIDVTVQMELRRLSAEAEALAAVGTLTAGLAHEIRNPLNAASLQLQVLRRRARRLSSADRLLAPVDIVRKELSRLSVMLDEFLGFARPDRLEAKVIVLRELLEDVVALERLECEEAGVHIEASGDAQLTARGDRSRLQQVLVNLVRNAVEAMRERGGGTIQLGVSDEGDTLCVSVRDDGPGPPEDAGEVFRPFFTTKAAGTGLGLAIVDKIVRMHGGEVSLRARPGGGASAEFTLPRRRSMMPGAEEEEE